MRPAATRRRRGFSLTEVLISLTLAMVVVSSATAFAVQSWQTRRGWTVRETVDRDARFVGLSIARDVQEAGIALTSTPVFASMDTNGDTLSVLSVPYQPAEAPVYPIYNDGDTLPTYPAGGTCGATCIDFQKVGGTYALAAGDLVRLQVANTRRLLLLTSVQNGAGNLFRIQFLPVNRLVNRPSGLDSLLLMRSGTTIQKLNVIMYYRDAGTNQLMRASSLNSLGQPVGAVVASNVEAFNARLLFTNGTESVTYNGVDADTLNDGNDLIGAKVRAKIRSFRSDPAVNNGQPVARWYEWRVAPRNLLYEKNRM
ncbi:MAG: prepilin-type N-terminal cleavage/methylation domain-containing protein [Gemmatimonadaceae bacterium]|nr:prepilin-type N-terminal cleavage/methylation domain-containing protein [Gemmatimonadaceae bacterium]